MADFSLTELPERAWTHVKESCIVHLSICHTYAKSSALLPVKQTFAGFTRPRFCD